MASVCDSGAIHGCTSLADLQLMLSFICRMLASSTSFGIIALASGFGDRRSLPLASVWEPSPSWSASATREQYVSVPPSLRSDSLLSFLYRMLVTSTSFSIIALASGFDVAARSSIALERELR